MNNKYFGVELYIWMAYLLSSLFFVYYPQLDLTIAAYFYKDNHFILRETPWIYTLYYSVKWVLIFTLLSSLSLSLYNKFKKSKILNYGVYEFFYTSLVALIGAGLIVNFLFKEQFGRARPVHLMEFGGESIFTPAYVLSDQCLSNCSFSCGHASGAFVFIAFALLYRSKVALSLAFIYGFLVGLARMAEGGHFFSDVIVSFFVMLIVAKSLHYYMIERKESVN